MLLIFYSPPPSLYRSPSRNSFMSGRRPDATKSYNFLNHFREEAVGANWTALPECKPSPLFVHIFVPVIFSALHSSTFAPMWCSVQEKRLLGQRNREIVSPGRQPPKRLAQTCAKSDGIAVPWPLSSPLPSPFRQTTTNLAAGPKRARMAMRGLM